MNTFSNRSLDEFLVLEAQSGNRSALTALVERWQPRLLGYAHVITGDRDLAKDCLQDAWLKAIRNLAGLRDPVTFEAWIHRIVQRRCIDLLRQRSRYEPIPDNELQAGANADHAEFVRMIRPLTINNRTVIALHYLQGFSIQEIANILRVPAGTVKSRLFKAREQIKQQLAEDEETINERSRPTDQYTAERSHTFQCA